MTDTPVKKMTKTESREIRKLVKDEYSFLDSELGGETQRIKADVRQQFDAEAEAALVNARKRTDKLRAKAKKLEEEAHETLRELQSQGFELGGYRTGELLSFTIHDDSLKVATVEKRMKAAFDAVDSQVHTARRSLKLNENEAVRKLTLGMCESAEAEMFIKNIPSLAELVSMPDLKALKA